MEHTRRTWSLDTTTDRIPGGIVVTPRGRIGAGTAPAFAAALAAARAESASVVIDLQGVDYISGAGVTALLDLTAGAGSRAILCELREPVRVTLELAGLLDNVEVEATRADALEKLGHSSGG
jgi:anti-anti-sigma factor